MSSTRFLDLCCGAGGASMGLHLAHPDAEITGVDLHPQPRYPFRFVQADAMTFGLDGYDFVWASVPCQGYSRMRHLPWLAGKSWPLLIAPMRERLTAWGGPWLIENVEDARTGGAITGGYLCGAMFGRPYYRHRVFETSFPWLAPPHPKHLSVIRAGSDIGGRAREIVFRSADRGGALQQPSAQWGYPRLTDAADGRGATERVRDAFEIDWMTGKELCQAIPPIYSRHLAGFIPGLAS